MQGTKLKQYLDRSGVHYEVIYHLTSYTAQDTAEISHISGKEIAKTVIVNIGETIPEMIMVVLPASYKVDFNLLKKVMGIPFAILASEEEFRDMFPDCDVGAMPPFGSLYRMDVVVDNTLAEDDDIVFNAGSHQELIKMNFLDYQRLANPHILHLTMMATA